MNEADAIEQASHRSDLNNVFIFSARAAAASTQDVREVAEKNLAYSLQQIVGWCRQSIGCGDYPGSVLAQFLRRQDWSRYEAPRQLWAQYQEVGLVKVNELLPYSESLANGNSNSRLLTHPLEAAVQNGNLGAFAALLEVGADIEQVPTQGYRLKNAKSERGPIVDIYSFILAKAPSSTMAGLMASHLTQFSMEQRIRQVEAPPSVDKPAPVARRKLRLL